MKRDEQVSEKPNSETEIDDGDQSHRLGEPVARPESSLPDEPRDVEMERRSRGEPDELEDLNWRHLRQ